MNDYSNNQNTLSLGQINNFIKAVYFLQIQIYEKCNVFNDTVNTLVFNLEEELKSNRILTHFNPNVMCHMMMSGKNFFNPNYSQYQENFLSLENNNNYAAGNAPRTVFEQNMGYFPNNSFVTEPNKYTLNSNPFVNLNSNTFYNDFKCKYNQNSSDHQKNEELTKEKSDNDSLSNRKKQKYLDMKNKKKSKKYFQIPYMFKNKIKRTYRIDVMTKKININLYNFLKENQDNLKINNDLLEFFKNNIRFSTKNRFLYLERKYPKFRTIYEEFLKSEKFKKMINIIKTKHDEEYLKLFFRHTKNFLNLYLKDTPYCKLSRRLGSKHMNSTIKNADRCEIV